MTVKLEKTRSGFWIRCRQCGLVHELEQVSDRLFILDGDPSDEFRIEGERIVPDWVCRNAKCRNSATLRPE
jgi:hypothetical protein